MQTHPGSASRLVPTDNGRPAEASRVHAPCSRNAHAQTHTHVVWALQVRAASGRKPGKWRSREASGWCSSLYCGGSSSVRMLKQTPPDSSSHLTVSGPNLQTVHKPRSLCLSKSSLLPAWLRSQVIILLRAGPCH